MMKICLHKLLGHCPGCTVDMETDHHPNNRDCKGFEEVTLWHFDVTGDDNETEILPTKNDGGDSTRM